MQFSKEVKATLWGLIDDMALSRSEFTVNPDKNFTRKKKWDFPTLIKFIISMESQSLKNELYKYFGYTTDCPSNASFNQRRAQIKSDAFKHLFEEFTSKYSGNPSLFNGYRLIACDASDINISHDPNDRETYFTHGDGKGFNQLHLNAMESYNNIAHVIEKGAFFLFRCKDINSSGILSGSKSKLPSTETFDVTLSLILTRKWTKEVLEHPEKYRRFRSKDSFDFLDLDEHAYYNMNLRVLRFPISDTEYECVITNLPREEFSYGGIKKLYAMRWGIETSFRELKYAVGLTSFHSKKREYITPEIWARLILYNFCEIITVHVTIKKCTQKHVYQINYTFAIHICKYFISKMAEISPPDVEALISKEILPVRLGRHVPRKVDHKKAVSFLYRVE